MHGFAHLVSLTIYIVVELRNLIHGGFWGQENFGNGFEFLRAPEVATTDDDDGDSDDGATQMQFLCPMR